MSHHFEDNARATGRTSRMLFRAVCAVASGKPVIVVSPSRSNMEYMKGLLKTAGFDNPNLRFVTFEGVQPLTSLPGTVRFFYDHAAVDAAIHTEYFEARRVLESRGMLAE
jgi:endonuclease V-like protein UPF0215 family